MMPFWRKPDGLFRQSFAVQVGVSEHLIEAERFRAYDGASCRNDSAPISREKGFMQRRSVVGDTGKYTLGFWVIHDPRSSYCIFSTSQLVLTYQILYHLRLESGNSTPIPVAKRPMLGHILSISVKARMRCSFASKAVLTMSFVLVNPDLFKGRFNAKN